MLPGKMHRLDHDLARSAEDVSPIDLTDVGAARETLRRRNAGPPADYGKVAVSDSSIASSQSGPASVAIRTYKPRDAGPLPAIVHVHGGGFMLGDISSSDARCVRFAEQVGAHVISVGYRLAPEHPFPAALDDVVAVVLWTHENSADLGIDRSRIVLHGISAGAGLAAGACLYLRDNGLPMPCFQFLSIPMLDDRLETASAERYIDSPGWDRLSCERAWSAYVPNPLPEPEAMYAAPARATDLSTLPDAYVSVSQHDPLRDEGIAYAQRLLDAGVNTELHVFPGTFHGSVRIPSNISEREVAEEVAVLKAALLSADGEVSEAVT